MCLIGRRTLAVVDSAYTTAMAGSKNKRFNPVKFARHGRDPRHGGPDTAAQEAANQYDAERAVWHAQHSVGPNTAWGYHPQGGWSA